MIGGLMAGNSEIGVFRGSFDRLPDFIIQSVPFCAELLEIRTAAFQGFFRQLRMTGEENEVRQVVVVMPSRLDGEFQGQSPESCSPKCFGMTTTT